ncbi:OstA-like protein [Flavobacterium cyanobacteriorum]|uniref:OstA-like protein n=1 Tax=Flavobacterium cyanobacteriorum TaxID=2022802 RepID=A0A255Z9X3_9FLAO|nr:OstA-like protein [Flavobacterium cyanobacteriorum]OYQ38232.1 OstA-like protein [Flavobacterium cyanobacteriorum]
MKKLLLLLLTFTLCSCLWSQNQKKNSNIIIENSDFVNMNQDEVPGAIVFIGNVSVWHDGVRITCNKAYHFKDENYVKLFGSVKMNQGDSLFMDSRYAEYNGNRKFAYATGNVVMRSPDMTLTTDTVNFDRTIQQAFYNTYGTIVNGENTLKSKSGRYIAGQKKYEFRTAVTLTNPKHVLKSNHLDYYTNSGHSYVFGPSTITSREDYIYTENGFYDTKKNEAQLLTNSYIRYGTRIIKGDKLYYNKPKNYSSGTNNVRITDTVNKYVLEGHYGEIFRRPQGDSLVMTKHAVAKTLVEKDTLYTHARVMMVTGKQGGRIIRGYNNARFYKTDMSGKCDSIHSDEAHGLTRLIKRPVVWNGVNQMTGQEIHLVSSNKTKKLDSLKVLGNAFIIQKDTLGTGYTQIKGKNMYGKFRDNKLYEVDLVGNAEKIIYMYDKQELFGIDKGVGSSIHLELSDNKITSATLLRKIESQIYPDAELPQNVRKLRGFEWRGDEIIKSKDDIFPPEEQELHDKIVNRSEKEKLKEDKPMEPLRETLEYDRKNPGPALSKEKKP